jgi:CheY-like chemotaxis protein
MNGPEGVQKAREVMPDIILLDLRMPGMDGREALVEIRKIPGLEVIPVIAVTASSLMNEERDLKERFTGYVRKPFSKFELFTEIAHFMPRQPEAEPTQETPADSGSAPYFVAREIIAPLRHLLTSEWPGVCECIAINESKAFAAKLHALAQQWSCLPLAAYAQSLDRHAESYAVVDLEQQLQKFPTLVERLEQSALP